ncbi:unnamed protein product [Clavelina lepadiformis]|uniref:Protein kinase domain-containing protein n=1 Tax=Clavelina lepadiformis TaxID=159417 RepID=A0ABP0GWE9_CLALP
MSFTTLPVYNPAKFLTGEPLVFGKNLNVLKCKHSNLGRVVVKIHTRRRSMEKRISEVENDDTTFNRILHEAQLLMMMNHENIIRFHGVTRWPGFAGIVLELAECGDLRSFVSSKDLVPDIPWWLRQRTVLELFQALRYLHNYRETTSIVHGNIRSLCILLTKRLTVKLVDMHSCIFKTSDDVLPDENFQYTPSYTAPEVLQNPHNQTTCADVYSASLVAYEIITRRFIAFGVPHQPRYLSPITLRMRQVNKVDGSLRDDATNFPIFKNLKQVMLGCGKAKPEDRLDANTVVDLLNKNEIDFYGPKQSEEAWVVAKNIIEKREKLVYEREPLDMHFRLKGLHSGTKQFDHIRQQKSGKSKIRKKWIEGDGPGLEPESGDDLSTMFRRRQASVSKTISRKNSCDSDQESDISDDYIVRSNRTTPNTSPSLRRCRKRHQSRQLQPQNETATNIAQSRWWIAPVKISYVYETYTTVGQQGGTINIADCKVIIPQGALIETCQLKFTLLYGREMSTNNGAQVLTPTLGCMPSREFLKPVTVQLPTCYVPQQTVSVIPQKSEDGRMWTDLDEVEQEHGYFITYQTSSFSWQRVVMAIRSLLGAYNKRLVYLCYRHPSSTSDPYFTWEFRDDVMDPHDLLKPSQGFKGTVTVRSGEDLLLKLSSPNTWIQPDEKTVVSNDMFEQGFLLQQNFHISKQREQVDFEDEHFSYEIKSALTNRIVRDGIFPFLDLLPRERLTQITLSNCSLTNSPLALSARDVAVSYDASEQRQKEVARPAIRAGLVTNLIGFFENH